MNGSARGQQSGEIVIGLDDLTALAQIDSHRRRRLFRFAGWFFIAASLLWWTVGASRNMALSPVALLYSLALASLFLVLGSPRTLAMIWQSRLKRDPLFAPMRYGVDADHLDVISANGISHVRWQAFDRIEAVGDRLFLFLTGRLAFIVPRRAFESPADFQAFADSAVAAWRNASDSRLDRVQE